MISKSKFILSRVGIQEGEISLIRMADMRYQGQGHEIVVPLPDVGSFSAESIPGIEQSFEDTYRKLYGRTIANVPVEVVSFRLFAMGPTPRVAFQGGQDARACDGQAVKGSRPAYFPDAGGLVETQVLDRYSLYPGYTGKGPAIIEERESTAIVPPGWRFTLDKNASLIIEVEK